MMLCCLLGPPCLCNLWLQMQYMDMHGACLVLSLQYHDQAFNSSSASQALPQTSQMAQSGSTAHAPWKVRSVHVGSRAYGMCR